MCGQKLLVYHIYYNILIQHNGMDHIKNKLFLLACFKGGVHEVTEF